MIMLGFKRAGKHEAMAINPHQTHHVEDTRLPDVFTEILGFRQILQVAAAGAVLIDFACAVEHRGIVKGLVHVAARLRYRAAATEAGLARALVQDIKPSGRGSSTIELGDTCGTVAVSTALATTPGWYRFEVHMCASSEIPHMSGDCAALAHQGNAPGPRNFLRVIEIEGASVSGLAIH